jgi:hypothetical protein
MDNTIHRNYTSDSGRICGEYGDSPSPGIDGIRAWRDLVSGPIEPDWHSKDAVNLIQIKLAIEPVIENELISVQIGAENIRAV